MTRCDHSDLLLRLAQCRASESPRLYNNLQDLHRSARFGLTRTWMTRRPSRTSIWSQFGDLVYVRRMLGLVLTLWIVFTLTFC